MLSELRYERTTARVGAREYAAAPHLVLGLSLTVFVLALAACGLIVVQG